MDLVVLQLKKTSCEGGGGALLFLIHLVVFVTKTKKAGPLVEYKRRIAAGDLEDGDSCQMGTLREIQRLYDELVESADACRLDRYSDSGESGRIRWLWSRFIPQSTVSPVKGLYLYGGVGTGKTMLMDLFNDQLPCTWRKKRIHFHDFMLTVHSRLQRPRGVSDPLEVVAGEIFDESVLLRLDEFIVNDVADATILNRLFGHLFSNGAILVATSIRAPDNLYERGLQRDLFLPFIASLKERCVIHEIGSSIDYRRRTSCMTSSTDDQKLQPNLKYEPEKFPVSSFPSTRLESLTLGRVPTTKQVTKTLGNQMPPIPIPPSNKMAKLNLNTTNDNLEPPLPLTLNLSTSTPSTSSEQQSSPSSSTRHTSVATFQEISGSFNSSNGDNIISVA